MFRQMIVTDWRDVLSDLLSSDLTLKLEDFVNANIKTMSPSIYSIFRSINMCSFESTKVVIIGQDPYPSRDVADGLAFSTWANTQKLPPSLRMIFKELDHEDPNWGGYDSGSLIPWAQRGVLLLNSRLTSSRVNPKDHRTIGWDRFTDEIVQALNKKTHSVVFMLWGNDAKRKYRLIDHDMHLVLTAGHPSPICSVDKFSGCGHFLKANEYLDDCGIEPIDWSLKA